MKNLKFALCHIGIHDWVILEHSTQGKDRVCIRCKKKDMRLSEWRYANFFDEREARRRLHTAERILKEEE